MSLTMCQVCWQLWPMCCFWSTHQPSTRAGQPLRRPKSIGGLQMYMFHYPRRTPCVISCHVFRLSSSSSWSMWSSVLSANPRCGYIRFQPKLGSLKRWIRDCLPWIASGFRHIWGWWCRWSSLRLWDGAMAQEAGMTLYSWLQTCRIFIMVMYFLLLCSYPWCLPRQESPKLQTGTSSILSLSLLMIACQVQGVCPWSTSQDPIDVTRRS